VFGHSCSVFLVNNWTNDPICEDGTVVYSICEDGSDVCMGPESLHQ
jgi:hypothetical protein